MRPGHHIRLQAQTFDVLEPITLYRAVCRCGWTGDWHRYGKDAETVCPLKRR